LTAILRKLLPGNTREANIWREHTQRYNSASAFASMGAEIKLQLEMIHAVSAYAAKFNGWSHRYFKTRQISQDMDNFTF
jgi:hypothetical protein